VQVRRKRFIRQPEAFGSKQLTAASFQILATVERFRFLPSSLLIRLAGGNQRNNYRHLQTLYHKGMLNRFALPTVYGTPGEFVYYLDTRAALQLLIDRGLLQINDEQRRRKEETIRFNQQKAYHQLHKDPNQQGKLLYIQHELMVSRFHGLLELACQKFAGKVFLEQWKQGPELWNRVQVPAVRSDDGLDNMEKTEWLPHRPDAFFTLLFPASGEQPEQRSHFLYEADRKTENTTRYKLKLRAHWQFTVKQQLQRTMACYNVHAFRAVLTESIDTSWSNTLRLAAREPIVSGKPSALFWFTSSEALTGPLPASGPRKPRYLDEPELVFRRIWHSPVGDKPFSLLD
jgi:hypothetical protein